MNRILFSVVCILLISKSYSQINKSSEEYNFGFENTIENTNLPAKWNNFHKIEIDTVEKHSGKSSLFFNVMSGLTDKGNISITQSIPVNFKGKEIELQAFIKIRNYNRIKNSDYPFWIMIQLTGETGFINSTKPQLINFPEAIDWTLYSAKLTLPENAKTIIIGISVGAMEQLWVDDLMLFIDGKDFYKVKKKSIKCYNADKDKEFDKGSKIGTINLTEKKTEDLVVLGKVWGFLKYYHPMIAQGEYNWDYELFRILPKIIDAKNDMERNNILSIWVDSIGKVKKGKSPKIKRRDVKLYPDLKWINDSLLGEQLTKQLLNIKNAKRENNNYYIGLVPGVKNPIFKNENAYWSMRYPDVGFRLLCLFRYWNIIHYYFPNKHLIGKDWNLVLKDFIPEFAHASDELEYRLAVLALIASIHDTHANFNSPDSVIRKHNGLNSAPLEIIFIENNAVVSNVLGRGRDRGIVKFSGLEKGDIINIINDKTVEELIKEKLPYTSASNYDTQLRLIAPGLLRTNDTIMTITYKRGDTTFANKRINCYSMDMLSFKNKFRIEDTCFKLLTPDISYLNMSNIKKEDLKVIMPEVLKSKGLIIDFRCYPSDFLVFSIGEYLLPEKTSFVKFSEGSIETPGLFTFTKKLKSGSKNRNFYKGKVVILVNEYTQSSAEYQTMGLKTAPNAVVIGSTTAGADGNVSKFYLPGGIETKISGIGVYYPDGKETQRIGILPDIECRPTIEGIKKGKDEVLDRAIEYINKGK